MTKEEGAWLAERFEEHRPRLRAVAYRMLGSVAEAEEAVQDTWLRASRAGAAGIDDIRAWLTTIVARVSLNALQARKVRQPGAAGVHLPDPIVGCEGSADPENELLLADAVGLALQVVIETLAPAERIAFVLHDMFGVSFDDIAAMVGRTSAAARQLASRGRRRVREAAIARPEEDLAVQRRVVDEFFAASQSGDFERLVAVLHPDVVLRADGGGDPRITFVRRGAHEVAGNAIAFSMPLATLHPALVNGAAGMIVSLRCRPFAVMAFTVVGGRVVAIDAVAGRARLDALDLPRLDEMHRRGPRRISVTARRRRPRRGSRR